MMMWYRLLTLWQVELDHVGRLSVVEGGFENRLPELRSQWLDLGPGAPTSNDNLNDFYNHPELCRTLNAKFLRTIPQRSSPLLASELSRELNAGPIPVLILRRSLDSTRVVFTAMVFFLMNEILDFLGEPPSYGRRSVVVLALYFTILHVLFIVLYPGGISPYYKPTKLELVSVFAFTVICARRTYMVSLMAFIWSLVTIIFCKFCFWSDLRSNNGRLKDGFCRTIFLCVRASNQVSDSDGHR
jgi:hypothetical protein